MVQESGIVKERASQRPPIPSNFEQPPAFKVPDASDLEKAESTNDSPLDHPAKEKEDHTPSRSDLNSAPPTDDTPTYSPFPTHTLAKWRITLSPLHLLLLTASFLLLLFLVTLYTFAALTRGQTSVFIALGEGGYGYKVGGQGGTAAVVTVTATVVQTVDWVQSNADVETQMHTMTEVEPTVIGEDGVFTSAARGVSSAVATGPSMSSSTTASSSSATLSSPSVSTPSTSAATSPAASTVPQNSTSTLAIQDPAAPATISLLTTTLVTSVVPSVRSVSPLTRHYTGFDAIGKIMNGGF